MIAAMSSRQPVEQPSLFAPQRDVYTVSRLNREVRALLEGDFPLIWIEGEISNLSQPSSGHIYFSLKDAQTQVRCAMFRQRNRLLRFEPENGQQVLLRTRVSLYEARGEFQCIVEHMEEAGEGALRRKFEDLKKRLSDEGLFDSAHKKPLPALPRRIGIITSPTGAAVRDILNVLGRRFPTIPVLIYPVPVQGDAAAKRIARMIALADQRKDCDVLILARGGGSLEDLWAFNEEPVARAIYACETPLAVGVGHEVDVTIADFAADIRAPTPSGAAEMVAPDSNEWLRNIEGYERRLTASWERRAQRNAELLNSLSKRLHTQHPGQRLSQQTQQLDELEQRLKSATGRCIAHRHSRLRELFAHLRRLSPTPAIEQQRSGVQELSLRLRAATAQALRGSGQRLAVAGRALDAISPLATLERGYAIVTREREGKSELIRDAHSVSSGDDLRVRLAKGALLTRVERKLEE